MELLKSLGIDSTLWIHLACFLISYFTFKTLILKPYMHAMEEREKRTVGNEEAAVRLTQEAGDIYGEYEKKAKDLNAKIKSQYDQSRGEAMKEYERLVVQARSEAEKVLAQSREQIGTQIKGAKAQLSNEVPGISAAIASKLAGKEISL